MNAPLDDGLPVFGAPPVVEVAAGVQFRHLPGLRGVNMGLLRQKWRERYPRTQEVPALPPQLESSLPAPLVQIGFGPGPLTREWFLNRDETELVQVQADRLIVNWRKMHDAAEYPRYRTIRQLLAERLHDLRDLVDLERLGQLEVTQAELTYINSIPEIVEHPIDEVLAGMSWPRLPGFGRPEQVRASANFLVGDVGRPPVRLLLSVEPAPGPQGPTAFFTLTVRGAPLSGDEPGTLAFTDGAHGHIVRCFTEVTTASMHERWERLR